MKLQDEDITRGVWAAVLCGVCGDGRGESQETAKEIMADYLDGIRGFEVAEGTSERETRERCMNRMILALHCALSDNNIPALWRYKIVSDAMDRFESNAAYKKVMVRGWVE